MIEENESIKGEILRQSMVNRGIIGDDVVPTETPELMKTVAEEHTFVVDIGDPTDDGLPSSLLIDGEKSASWLLLPSGMIKEESIQYLT